MDMIAATLTIQAAPELLRVIERVADALEDLVRLQSDALHARTVPETTSSAGAPASAQAEPAGDSRAPDDISATAQPARVLNEPTAPAAASLDGGGKVWTEARNTYLRNARRAGFTRRAIFDALQKMPGAPISSPGAVAAQAKKLAKHAPHDTAPSPAPVAAPPVRRPAPSLQAIEADVDQIRSWAVQRGLTFLSRYQDMDLDRINLKRLALGLPPFSLIRRQARAA